MFLHRALSFLQLSNQSHVLLSERVRRADLQVIHKRLQRHRVQVMRLGVGVLCLKVGVMIGPARKGSATDGPR